MEQVSHRAGVGFAPPLSCQERSKGSTTSTQMNGAIQSSSGAAASSMHSLVLNPSPATVYVAATRAHREPAAGGAHVVTIRVNGDADATRRAPKISSVHLKSDVGFDTFRLHDNNNYKRNNNTLVRITLDESPTELDHEEKNADKAPYINCNSYPLGPINTVMSSGQCSPSDTLDSGTCSDLDGTPPPLPKKKTSKTTTRKKAVTVTMIGTDTTYVRNEVDFEDDDSNISCDSLNSSEFNGSTNIEENTDDGKKAKKCKEITQQQTSFTGKDGFLPRGLLQDIRDRTTKLSILESEHNITENRKDDTKINKITIENNNRLQAKTETESKQETSSLPVNINRTPIVIETTYEERKKEDEMKKNRQCISSEYFDTDKYYDFHLNEKQFDVKEVKSGNANGVDEVDGVEYFAGVKDYKIEEAPSTIKSSKGTIRGVKNRVRAGIATFLQINNAVKSYREKDAGKVVLYTTTMGIVRSTYQRCVLVKKILRNLLVKYEERDVFMSTDYQDEIRERMNSDDILVPQLFVDGHHIGDADTVEKLNESGELRKMLRPYKSPDACNTCGVCGGFRLLPCRICSGSKKSLHRNHFTAEFVALKCMNCDEVGLVRCDACS